MDETKPPMSPKKQIAPHSDVPQIFHPFPLESVITHKTSLSSRWLITRRAQQSQITMKLLARFQNGLADMRALQSFRRPRKVKEADPTEATTDDESVASGSVSPSTPIPQTQQQQQPPFKGVRFSNKLDGRVTCTVRTFEKIEDPALWFQPEETLAIQEECIYIVEENRSGPNCIDGPTVRFIERGWKDSANRSREILSKMKETPEVRGLERHVVQKYDQIMNDHIRNVLEIQATTNNEYLLRLASRQSSQAWEELARIRAQHDEAAIRKKTKRVTHL